MLPLHLPAMVRPLPPVEPVRVSRSKEPSLHARPGVDARHTALQQVRCMSAALLAAHGLNHRSAALPQRSRQVWCHLQVQRAGELQRLLWISAARSVLLNQPFSRPAFCPRTCPHLLSSLGIFASTCNVDVRWFPFDIQRCELKFGSWTFDGWLLDIQMKEADISGYMHNGEWDLLGETDVWGTKMGFE